MYKHQAGGRIKKIEARMNVFEARSFGDKSLQDLGLTEKKIKRIQGDYRDTTHDFKKRR
ncbi:MAG: hypothetical protein ABI171_06065 [Collimonas sp.]|uniref:hypothetical protein n=1 Tax=Collimonas sp. TaxID=1963772 RepID=UPI0032657828